MTPEQMQLVRLSLAQATIDPVAVGREFYRHLFSIAPELGARFNGDIAKESRKFNETLTLAFGSLSDMRFLVATLEGLARRGVAQRLSEPHCRAIGKALLYAIETRIGAGFTPPVCEAWIALLAVVLTFLRGPVAELPRTRAA
jgi:hemoglobin-like flavoprotein